MTTFEKICIALIALIAAFALYGSITEKSPETRGTLYISGERMCDDGRKINSLTNFEVRQ